METNSSGDELFETNHKETNCLETKSNGDELLETNCVETNSSGDEK